MEVCLLFLCISYFVWTCFPFVCPTCTLYLPDSVIKSFPMFFLQSVGCGTNAITDSNYDKIVKKYPSLCCHVIYIAIRISHEYQPSTIGLKSSVNSMIRSVDDESNYLYKVMNPKSGCLEFLTVTHSWLTCFRM